MGVLLLNGGVHGGIAAAGTSAVEVQLEEVTVSAYNGTEE